MSVKAFIFAGVFALMAVSGIAGPASAQYESCTGNPGIDWDIQIGSCTAAIQSGRWQGKGVAWAFQNRGIVYRNKGQYDRAIQDFDQAISLDPNDAYAFNSRGNVYKDKGQYDRAIQDFDQAIKTRSERRRRLQRSRHRLPGQRPIRPRHPRLRSGAQAQSELRLRLQQSRRRLQEQRPIRPRHRGL